jgi:hypothetical protein
MLEVAPMSLHINDEVISMGALKTKVLRCRVPSDKTARAMKQARDIRQRFDSIDDMLRDADGETAEKAKTR